MTPSTASEEIRVLEISRYTTPAEGVRELELVQHDGKPLPVWEPGAHVDLILREGLVRQYSLCGDPSDRSRLRIAVLREPRGRGGSAIVHDQLGEGNQVEVRGTTSTHPGTFVSFRRRWHWHHPGLPMLAAASSTGAQVELHYGGRTRGSMAYAETLLATYGDRVTIYPADKAGLLPVKDLLSTLSEQALVYACGPEPLLHALEDASVELPPDTLHIERFHPRDGAGPLSPADADPFLAELASSGAVHAVPPDRSVLSVLQEVGAPVLSSCTQGACGTCETGVLDGEVDHRDSLLTPEERDANDVMFVCVSRAAHGCHRLVLDL